MSTERAAIKNRYGLKLVIKVDTPENPKNLVFIQPGQGGFIEQVHISAFAEAFLENGFRTVRFDPTNSLGESGGDPQDVTYDNYLEDLEDVINWARTQPWFQQPFALCGHSMGAQSTAWYAEHHPQEVELLAPVAPPVHYGLWVKTLAPQTLKDWQEKGYKEDVSRSKPGVVKKIGWGVNESLKKFDLLPNADKLTMPAFFMAGEFDEPCPYKNQKVLFDLIPSKNKKFVEISDAEHSFRNNGTKEYGKELQEAKTALSAWLRDINRLAP